MRGQNSSQSLTALRREPLINPGFGRNYAPPNSSTKTPKHSHARYRAATVAQETRRQDPSRRVCGFCRVAPARGQIPCSSASTGGSNSGCPGGGPPAIKARDSRFGHLDAVLAIFTAVIASKNPPRSPDLMAYMTIVAKASQKFAWTSWVVYDQNFCQEAACSTSTQWARVNPSIYTQCFTGMAIGAEGWCKKYASQLNTHQRAVHLPPSKWNTLLWVDRKAEQAHSAREWGRHSQLGPLNALHL